MVRRALAVLLVVCGAGVPDARAATVHVRTFPLETSEGSYHVSRVYVVAGPGERNAVAVRQPLGRVIRITDRGGTPLRAREGCEARSATTVECPGGYHPSVRVFTGDGDDVVRMHRPARVSGGPGDDLLVADRDLPDGVKLHGGSGADVLTGTPQFDRLDGGPGRDRLLGRAGDDELQLGDGADHAPDFADGGPGDDLASWVGATRPLRIAWRDGAYRHRDEQAVRVERLLGGRRDDVLVGSNRGERFDGGPGDDLLIGRGGSDEFFEYRAVGRDEVRCGPGARDEVYHVFAGLLIGDDGCERLQRIRPLVDRTGPDEVTVAVDCLGSRCRKPVALVTPAPDDPWRPAGIGPHRALSDPQTTGDGRRTVVLALTPLGRRYLAVDGRPACVRRGRDTSYCYRVAASSPP